MLRIFWKKTNK